MKISQYRREGKEVNIIISAMKVFLDDCLLMKDFKEKYLPYLVGQENVRFLPLQDLCFELDDDIWCFIVHA